MALIDTDSAYAVLTDYYHHTTDTQHAALKEALGRVESVDAVPVVRCRDCRHHDGIRCFRWNSTIITGFNDFCSNGERKDGEHETD